MKIQLINNLDAFEKIHKAWDELVLSADPENVYVTSIWLEATIENFLNDDELFLFCAWEGDVLEAALPLKRSYSKLFPGLRLCTYENITGIYTGHFDFPVRNRSFGTLKKVWEAFQKHTRRWDILELNYVREDTLAHQLFKHVSGNHKNKFNEQIYLGSDYICHIQENWETYLGLLGKNTRQNIKKSNNRLFKSGGFSVEKVQTDDDLDEKYEVAKMLERKSWKGHSGSVRTADYEKFLKSLCKKKSDYSRPDFYLLKIGSDYAAFILCIMVLNYVVAVVTGYDKKYEYYSPGQYVFCEILKDAHLKKYNKIDLFHNSGNYKSKIVIEKPVPKFLFRITNKTPQSIFHKTFVFFKSRLNNLIPRAPFKKIHNPFGAQKLFQNLP
ncbi:MAG: GNAT family N-acetyltransferase [Syntrophaceae bacterium]|nr:GNAT family N-acetyltransferase [Syntrophaceae bacterium]